MPLDIGCIWLDQPKIAQCRDNRLWVLASHYSEDESAYITAGNNILIISQLRHQVVESFTGGIWAETRALGSWRKAISGYAWSDDVKRRIRLERRIRQPVNNWRNFNEASRPPMDKEKWDCIRAIGLVVDEVKWYLISKL